MTLGFCSYAIPTILRVIPTHYKKSSDFEQLSDLKCIPTTKPRFSRTRR